MTFIILFFNFYHFFQLRKEDTQLFYAHGQFIYTFKLNINPKLIYNKILNAYIHLLFA